MSLGECNPGRLNLASRIEILHSRTPHHAAVEHQLRRRSASHHPKPATFTSRPLAGHTHPYGPHAPLRAAPNRTPLRSALKRAKRINFFRRRWLLRASITRARRLNPSLRCATAKAPNTFRPVVAALPRKLSGRRVAPSFPCAGFSPQPPRHLNRNCQSGGRAQSSVGLGVE